MSHEACPDRRIPDRRSARIRASRRPIGSPGSTDPVRATTAWESGLGVAGVCKRWGGNGFDASLYEPVPAVSVPVSTCRYLNGEAPEALRATCLLCAHPWVRLLAWGSTRSIRGSRVGRRGSSSWAASSGRLRLWNAFGHLPACGASWTSSCLWSPYFSGWTVRGGLSGVGWPGQARRATDPIAEQGSVPEWAGQGWPETITE